VNRESARSVADKAMRQLSKRSEATRQEQSRCMLNPTLDSCPCCFQRQGYQYLQLRTHFLLGLFAQQALQDFATGILWDALNEHNATLWHLVRSQALSHVVEYILRTRLVTLRLSSNNIRSRQLRIPSHHIRYTNDCTIDNVWMVQENAFQLWRSDLECSDFDEFLALRQWWTGVFEG